MRVDVGMVELQGKVRVLLDGVDISDDCFAADDDAGVAFCYVRDDAGSFQIDAGPNGLTLAREVRTGRVEIVTLK